MYCRSFQVRRVDGQLEAGSSYLSVRRVGVENEEKVQEGFSELRIAANAESRLNYNWSMDLVSDGLSGRRRFGILACIDQFSRYGSFFYADSLNLGV